jgi:hypothetical protein
MNQQNANTFRPSIASSSSFSLFWWLILERDSLPMQRDIENTFLSVTSSISSNNGLKLLLTLAFLKLVVLLAGSSGTNSSSFKKKDSLGSIYTPSI